MSDELDVQRGRQAQEVIDNPIYIEAFELLEQEIIKQWRDARETQDREQLHQLLLMLGKSKTTIESVMRSGEIAAAEIARKQSRADQIGSLYQRRWAS